MPGLASAVSHVIFGHGLEVKVDESLAMAMQAVLSMFALRLENSPGAGRCVRSVLCSPGKDAQTWGRIFCDLMMCCLPLEMGLMHKVTRGVR